MKSSNKLKLSCFFLVYIIAVCLSAGDIFGQFSQYYWRAEKKLTNGFYDKSPSFIHPQFWSFQYSNLDYLIFERKYTESDSLSRICVLKIDTGGVQGNPYYLSDGSYHDQNPNLCSTGQDWALYYAFAVWESKRAVGSQIIGCLYDENNGWGNPFIIDSSSENYNPKVAPIDTINYCVVYQSGDDIVFKKIQARNNLTTYYFNLTTDDTSFCSNPEIAAEYSDVQITYQHKRSDGNSSVFKRSVINNNWSGVQIISDNGNNRTSNFLLEYSGYSPAYESNKNGKWNIYRHGGNDTLPNTNANADNTSLQRFFNNIITDGIIYSHVYAYKEELLNEKRIMLNSFGYPDFRDTVIINSIEKTGLTINSGLMFINYDFLVWVVYNKDSAGISSLYGKSVRVLNTGIHETGVILSEKYSLAQNYPNPFNPITVIRYSIPSDVKDQTSDVKLVVYDNLGKWIVTLVNEKQNAGNYAVDFNGEGLPSGVYFYKLDTEDFSETKRMILLK